MQKIQEGPLQQYIKYISIVYVRAKTKTVSTYTGTLSKHAMKMAITNGYRQGYNKVYFVICFLDSFKIAEVFYNDINILEDKFNLK